MIRIGITLNIKKYYNGYIDFIDHYWLKIFEKKKIDFNLIPNTNFSSQKIFKKINLLILTGGNDIYSNRKESKIRNKVELNLIKLAIKYKIPIIGICRGAQLINIFFGGKIRRVKNHMRTRHNISNIKNPIFKNKKLNVNSFHSYGIGAKDISKKLNIIALDNKKNIEMFISKDKKIIGTMWHPEREKDTKLLDKLINYLKKN